MNISFDFFLTAVTVVSVRIVATRTRVRWDNKNDTILTIVPLGGSKGGSFEPPF